MKKLKTFVKPPSAHTHLLINQKGIRSLVQKLNDEKYSRNIGVFKRI